MDFAFKMMNLACRYTGVDGLTGWERARRANISGVHAAGWYDVFSEAQLETFAQLNDTSLGATAVRFLLISTVHCFAAVLRPFCE